MMRRFFDSFVLIFSVLIVSISLGGCSGGDGGTSDVYAASYSDGVTDNDEVTDSDEVTDNGGGTNNGGGTDNGGVTDPGNFKTPVLSCDDPASVCYDIVYVRYPIKDSDTDPYVTVPVGEKPYRIAPGADLMLLKQGGSEKVLVDCTVCSVMDPFISYDGKTVYYSLIEKGTPRSPSWIYKINLDDPSYTPIRLTFDDGYDSVLYKGNQDASGNLKSADHDQSSYRAIRDMAPVPLADGRILFTSNRSGLTTFHPFAEAVIDGSMQMLYVLDDHDGSANSKELSNLHLLEIGNLHMVQHPMQLMDGRLLFSSWQDAGTKFNGKYFRYASTTLFTLNPDGSNLKQFTEPHDHHKTVDHWATQLPGGEIVWENYYPGAWGYGLIMRAPLDPPGPDYLRNSVSQRYPYGNQYRISYREFDRKGMVSITPHTNNSDTAANNLSGKYSMPSVTSNGNLLVAYSTGGTSKFQDANYPLASGIYMIRNAAGGEADYITDPQAQLIKIKDDPNYNEIWPRAVMSYGDIYGISKPAIINNLAVAAPEDNRLLPGEAAALLGTSSMYNREPLNEANPDPFQGPGGNRETHDGNWTIQGASAGVFTDKDIYAVRVITTPPKPYTAPISKLTGTFAPCDSKQTDAWSKICRYLDDARLSKVVARYGSYHGERWEILGEFPVKKSGITDGQGNPDTSWQAKIPADTATFIQTIDKNGMTLVSEITWRALKSGEKRTDCGGCHAHSVEPLKFNTTEAGKNKPIVNIAGVNSNDNRVKDGIWDLTLNSIPLLNSTGVTFEPGYSYGVEFNRDVVPILNRRCVSCHKAGGSGSKFILDGSGGRDAWSVISEDGKYAEPQRSKYIRIPQARQSLLVWAAWDKRLDGRANATRSNDVDYSNAADKAHDALAITDKERRTIARWVDLGGPIDFPVTNGLGYTDDYQLPVVNLYTPHIGANASGTQLKVGFADAKSGLDLNTLRVSYHSMSDGIEKAVSINTGADVNSKNILTVNLPLATGEYIITVSINDRAGNKGVVTRRFKIGG